uniref:Uncharacterized protein n=1 Tax=Arundo donax TaxID=35708 RepID=A0A0A8ZPC9_ARUDO
MMMRANIRRGRAMTRIRIRSCLSRIARVERHILWESEFPTRA